jgi:hypothetical protein
MCCDLLQIQRDTTGLTAENRELKLRLQSMEEQAKLRDGMLWSNHHVFLNTNSHRHMIYYFIDELIDLLVKRNRQL